MLNQSEINEINAWANVLDALGREGHDSESSNQVVLKKITILVQKQLELLTKGS